ARERAAREVGERAAKAREALKGLQAERAKRLKTHHEDESKKSEPAASLTDPEARRMRFHDGAVRAGYNAQIAADARAGIIVAIEMTDRRNDAGLAGPIVDDIARRYGVPPKRLLVDTNYATAAGIAALAEHPKGPVMVFAPPPAEREDVKPETLAKRAKQRADEPDAVRAWRARWATPDGEAIYKRRTLIERINADRKNDGFGAMLVRGLRKVQAVALWHALAHNLIAAHRLRAAAA
ncbi:MAG: transposase, partial [Acetobacteraceae bacterium]